MSSPKRSCAPTSVPSCLVGVDARDRRRNLGDGSSSRRIAVEVDAEARRAWPGSVRASRGTGSPRVARELGDVVALVAVLGRCSPRRTALDRGAEAVHLAAGVVLVVLALDARARRTRAAGRRYLRSAPLRAEATVIGPVGFAETSSTWIRSGLSRRAAAVVGVDLGEHLAEERIVTRRLRKPGPATSARSISRQRERPSPRAPRRSGAGRGRAARGTGARRWSRSRHGERPRAARADLAACELAERGFQAGEGARRQRVPARTGLRALSAPVRSRSRSARRRR